MGGEPRGFRWVRRISEAVLLPLACLSPWAFGAVEAWAELLLDLGIALLGVLGLIVARGSDRVRHLVCAPSLALGALAILAVVQAVPLPAGVLRAIAPPTAALRA